MESQDLLTRIEAYQERLSRLLCSGYLTIRTIAFDRPARFDIEGVYIISTPDDKKIVYAGRTKTKTVTGRIRDHRSIDTQSDLKGMLRSNQSYPQEIDDYSVRCMEMEDSRERIFFEHFIISILKPVFNK